MPGNELIPALYVLVLNLAAFAAFGIDKYRAGKGQWRISERTLHLLALCGGSAGALLGMHLFHHKTRRRQFRWGLPLYLLAHLSLAVWLIFT